MHAMQPRVVPNDATTGLIQAHPCELHCSATEYGGAALFRSTFIAALLIPKTRDHLFECKSRCPFFQDNMRPGFTHKNMARKAISFGKNFWLEETFSPNSPLEQLQGFIWGIIRKSTVAR